MNRFAVLLLLITFVSGCASQGTNKVKVSQKPLYQIMREHYFRISPELSEDIKQKIIQRNIIVGMTPAEVRLSQGEPDYKSRVILGEIEIWSYEARYQAPRKLTFENGKLIKIENTKKIMLVKYGSKPKNTYNITGIKSAAKAETSQMVDTFVDRLFDRNRFDKKPFETIKFYEDKLIKRGFELEYNKENKKTIIRPVNKEPEFLVSKAIDDIIPGLPDKNIAYLEIDAIKLAVLVSGYQDNYAVKCREEASNGRVKEYDVVLNWYHSPLRKPDVFKTSLSTNIIKENNIYKPLGIINSFKVKSSEKFFFLTDFLDAEGGKTYKFLSTIKYPDGVLYNVGKEFEQKAVGYHMQYWISLDPSKDSRMIPGEYELKIYVNTFLTDTIKFTMME